MSAAGRSREDALISLVGSLRFEDLPDSAIEAALALILDQFTCALLGLEMPWTQSLRAVVGGSSSAVSGEVGGQLAYVYGEPSGVTPEKQRRSSTAPRHMASTSMICISNDESPRLRRDTGCDRSRGCKSGSWKVADRGGRCGAMNRCFARDWQPACGTANSAGMRLVSWARSGPRPAAARLLSGAGQDNAEAVADAVQLAASMGAGIKAFNEFGPGMVKRPACRACGGERDSGRTAGARRVPGPQIRTQRTFRVGERARAWRGRQSGGPRRQSGPAVPGGGRLYQAIRSLRGGPWRGESGGVDRPRVAAAV